MAKHRPILKQKERYNKLMSTDPLEWEGADIEFVADYQNALQLDYYEQIFNGMKACLPLKHRKELRAIRDDFVKVLQKKYDFFKKIKV